MSVDTRLRWHLELVGDPSRQMLKQDRSIRSSLQQTDRAQRKLADTATQTGRAQQRGSKLAATALQQERRAASSTARDVEHLNRAQAQALASGGRLASSSRRVADAYRGQARAAESLTRAERARGRAQQTGSRLAGAAGGAGAGLARVAAPAAAAAAGVAGVSIFAGFEQQMDRVQAVSGATGRELERMTALAKDLGGSTAFSAREAADGMYQLSTAGFKTREVIRTIPGVLDLAAASGVGLAEAAELQATTLRGFGLGAGQAGRVADALATTVNRSAVEMSDLGESLKYIAPVARATGQEMEGMLAAIGLMGNVGVKGSQAGTTLRTALVRLTDPTTKAKGALADLGIEASELRGPKGLLPLPQILAKVVRGAQDLDKGTRNQALARIFGREALSGMVALVDQGPKALNRNIDALKAADGQAKRTAKTMRSNVAGGWDTFTGSIETAAITLTTRFGPALAGALRGAGEGVTGLAAGGSKLLKGVSAGVRGDPERKIVRGAGGRVERVEGATGAAKIGQQIGGVARTIGTAAMAAGRQLLDAFKPALPFFQNVLLPLLKGVGQGILASIVGAFKVVVPVIKVFATGLGWIGQKLAPLRGLFQGVGQVIGFVFGGPILKGIGLLGKLGGVFRLIGPAAKLLALPIRTLGVMLGTATRVAGTLASKLAGPARAAFGLVGRAAGNVAGVVRGAVRGITGAASGIVRGIKRTLAPLAVNVYSVFRGAFNGALGLIKGLGGKFFAAGKGLVRRLVDGVKGIGGAIVRAFGSGLGFAADIGRALADWLNRKTPLGDKVNLPSPLPDFTLPRLRRGGRIPRRGHYQDGGLIPARVSPGELVQYGDSSWMVPGARTPRDSVLTGLPAGAAVFTADGQSRLAAGQDPLSALSAQAPHFRAGGQVHPGRYVATSYGPPWGGINGTGITRTGVNLKRNPRLYGIATDPAQIALGQSVYAWPNPFGYTGRFRAFDTGGAIQGNRIDFYDWRGRQAQNKWGRRTVSIGTKPIRSRKGGASYTAPGGSGASPAVSILQPSRRRSGLLPDAFQQGLTAGQEGLTRGAVKREGNPFLAALREQLDQAGPTGGGLSQKYSPESGKGNVRGVAAKMRSVAASTRRPYVFGGGHGRFSRTPRGLDCSGYVSHVVKYGGANPSLGAPITTDGTARYGRSGPGRNVTIHTRRGGVGGGHTLLTIGGRAYSSGNRRTGRLSGRFDASSSYLSTLPIKRHPVGLRRGGIVGFRAGGLAAPGAGGQLVRGANRALTFAGGSLEQLDTIIGQSVQERLLALRAALLRAVRRGGPKRVVERLQGMLSTVEFELGRRVGKILDAVSARSGRSERRTGALSRDQRRRGIDPASNLAIEEAANLAHTVVIPNAQANVRGLQNALARAKRSGDRSTVRELTGQLATAQDELDEQLTLQMERRIDLIRLARDQALAAAQETVDLATHSESLATSGLRRLELEQRLAGTFDGGGQARADFIRKQIIPAIEGELAALRVQEATANAQGDPALARQIAEQIDGKVGDKLQSQLDAQEAIAANTEPLKDLTTTLATEFAGGITTDQLTDFGLGT